MKPSHELITNLEAEEQRLAAEEAVGASVAVGALEVDAVFLEKLRKLNYLQHVSFLLLEKDRLKKEAKANMSLIVTPPESLKGTLTIPEKTLLGPGPSNVPERILKAMALPSIGHLHPEFCKVMDDCKAGVQYAFQTNNKMTLVLSSTGPAGMECVMTNLLEKDNVVLIANHGIWGERAMDMAQRQGGDHFLKIG